MRKFVLLAAFIALGCFPSLAKNPATSSEPGMLTTQAGQALTDAEVDAAIKRATHGKRHSIGLTLNDKQTSVLSAMSCRTCGVSGYTVTIYTPEMWIEQQAINAAREMRPFSASDVTQEMRQPDLRVAALPSRADYINAQGLSSASSVHRVVLCDTSKNLIIQPLQTLHGQVEDNSAFRSIDYASASSAFSMTDVARIRVLDQKKEFFVVVVGDNQNKYFKVKQKDFSRLFQ